METYFCYGIDGMGSLSRCSRTFKPRGKIVYKSDNLRAIDGFGVVVFRGIYFKDATLWSVYTSIVIRRHARLEGWCRETPVSYTLLTRNIFDAKYTHSPWPIPSENWLCWERAVCVEVCCAEASTSTAQCSR
ncbi:hypothetical protein CY34DRAFT_689106 [Suillus luteus UH-Slu-Lm8-n1]|uniref:Uncharacterized protein n=1 Tax=Suillus luteus UH-Slu-Lm8-n1 TaxID=930992 RepID=A0A0D0ANW6_9AGAM|nr:hypothetical protein CY34DRAFT_689106 [Suillus luteus UH-Slu-Lm8-n1]